MFCSFLALVGLRVNNRFVCEGTNLHAITCLHNQAAVVTQTHVKSICLEVELYMCKS